MFYREPVSDDLQPTAPSEPGETNLAIVKNINVTPKPRVRIKSKINAGITNERGNTDTDKYHLDAELITRMDKHRLTVGGEINRENADNETTAKNWKGYGKYDYFIRPQWFLYGSALFEHDEFADLDLRSTFSGGAGRYLVMTSRSELYLSAGLSALRETYSTEERGDWSSELALKGSYQLFLFQGRDTSLTSSISLLPSLSVSDRYRVEYAVSFMRKLVRDFTVSLNLNGSYDSVPPKDSKASDSSFRVSLGWTF